MRIVYEKKVLCIDNYKQICDIKSDLIDLKNCLIRGSNLIIKYLDKDRIIIHGMIHSIELKGDNKVDIQDKDEKK